MSEKSRSQSSIQPLITPEAAPPTLVLRARDVVAQQGDRTALTLVMPNGTQTFTTRQFFEQAARSALALEQAGVQRGDLVVLVLQHGPEVLSAGARCCWARSRRSSVPDAETRRNAITGVRAGCAVEVKAVVTYAEMLPALRAHWTASHAWRDPGRRRSDRERRAIPGRPLRAPRPGLKTRHSCNTRPARPDCKGRDAVAWRGAKPDSRLQRRDPPLADDVIVSWLPLYHDMGLIAGFVMPIVRGIHLVLMSPFAGSPIRRSCCARSVSRTLCWLPNFAYSFTATRVRRPRWKVGPRPARVINCSEPVRHESHVAFLEHIARMGWTSALCTCYAMAENTFAVTQSDLDRPPTLDVIDRAALLEQGRAVPAADGAAAVTMVSCGVPIPNTEIRVVNAQRQDLPERHIGEIALHSTSMLSGYYRRPDATAEAMADGWYFTGDLGYLADGELYITGRKKDLIIVGGKNIYPQDIEHAINDVPGVHRGGQWHSACLTSRRHGRHRGGMRGQRMTLPPATIARGSARGSPPRPTRWRAMCIWSSRCGC